MHSPGERLTVPKDLVAAVDQFSDDLPSPVMFTTEYGLWMRQSEWSFSQLQLKKTARCSTMTESRLSSLALMKINRDRCNELLSEDNMKRLVQAFTQQHPRRMKLSFMLPDED